jgi:hypothetical protein
MQTMKSSGGFHFLPTDGPFSGGVAADPGYQIVRVRAPRYTPLTEGFSIVEKTVEAEGRPLAALCAMELRIPKPLSRQAFDEFNAGYVAQLQRWGLPVDGRAAQSSRLLLHGRGGEWPSDIRNLGSAGTAWHTRRPAGFLGGHSEDPGRKDDRSGRQMVGCHRDADLLHSLRPPALQRGKSRSL